LFSLLRSAKMDTVRPVRTAVALFVHQYIHRDVG